MKKQILMVLSLALLIAGWAPKTARAQAPSKIAILNLQQAIAECEEGKKESVALNAKLNAKRAELEKLQKDIEALQKQLQDQMTALNDDARAQLTRQIEKKQNELKRQQEDANEEFQALSNEIVNKIGRKILRVVDQYATEQGYTAVLDSAPQGGLLWFSPTSNITTEIIRRYDAASAKPAAPPPAKPASPPQKP